MGKADQIKVVDIFAGPGGLGEGFSSFRAGGKSPFSIVLSAEKDQVAHRTLRLRAFYRRFGEARDVPDEYYEMVAAGLPTDSLPPVLAAEWDRAGEEALHLELGPETPRLHDQIERRVGRDDQWVLVGGPPCQAYSLAGRSRNKGKRGYVAEADHRQYLYQEYLKILSRFQPPVFIMENVRGILTATLHGERIFPTILRDLHDPTRAVSGRSGPIYDIYPLAANAQGPFDPTGDRDLGRFLIRAEELGIPQARHRVILMGVRRGNGLRAPRPLAQAESVSVGEVVGGLPKLRSALSKGDSEQAWEDAVRTQRKKVLRVLSRKDWLADVADIVETTEFIEGAASESTRRPDRRCRIAHADWYIDPRLPVTLNHSSRGHQPDDLGRYLFCAAYAAARDGRTPTSTSGDFPPQLAPEHKNWDSGHFPNRFRVQAPQRPSATVVSHISKDGHYFIHPDIAQCRSFTVREAARAQTFPDNYFFVGGRTDQFTQVGNAVPPLLARRIAEAVWSCLGS